MRILRYILILCVCAGIVGACSQHNPEAIRFGLSNMPTNMSPLYATDAASSRIGRLIYQRLVDFDQSKKPIPGIASWQIITPRLYRFKLNENAGVFSNGKALTAEDVKTTYNFVLDKSNASPHRAALTLIERIETPDEKTIDFHLNRTDPLFPGYLVIGILPTELVNANHPFERDPVGSGSMRFNSWPEDGRLVLERNSDNQRIEFIHVPKPTVRVLKLMRGEIDIVQNDLPPELINYLSDDKQLHMLKAKGSNYAYLGFNMEDPVLNNKQIRQALAYAINRDEIIQYVFGDGARKASSLLPPDHWAGNPEIKSLTYAPDKATALLEKAGYTKSKPLQLSYKTSNDPFRVRLATIMQSQLAQVGIAMDIMSYDWGTFYGDIKNGRFQLYSLAWIGIKTPDIFRYVFHSDAIPPNGANRGRFKHAAMDEYIEKAESQSDLETQALYYRKVQQLAAEELPYIPLWYENHVAITRNTISDYSLSWDGNYDGLNEARKRP